MRTGIYHSRCGGSPRERSCISGQHPYHTDNERFPIHKPRNETCYAVCGMWRRGLILTLALNLVALVPVPLSACAILAGLDGPCQCPMTMSCGPAAQPAARNGSAAISCLCIQSGEPSPEAIQSAASPTPALLTSNFVSITGPHQPASGARFPSTITPSDLAPPGGQALLCVFLI